MSLVENIHRALFVGARPRLQMNNIIKPVTFEGIEKMEVNMDSAVIMSDTDKEEKIHTDYIYMVSNNVLVISMNAELDHHLADEMRDVIDEIINKRGVTRIVIDFSKVDFMDSAGIGLIMGRYKKIRDIGDISVVGVNESIKRILLISGLHKIVAMYDNVMDALKYCNRREI